MTHKKKSVKPESEIDYQATKNAEDKIYSRSKKLYKKKKKLTKELMATIPGREHKWHGLGYKDTKESKRIEKELDKVKKSKKYQDKQEKWIKKAISKKDIKQSSFALREKDRLLKMGVYRDKKGGQVLDAPSRSKYEKELDAATTPHQPSVRKQKPYSSLYKKKLKYTQ